VHPPQKVGGRARPGVHPYCATASYTSSSALPGAARAGGRADRIAPRILDAPAAREGVLSTEQGGQGGPWGLARRALRGPAAPGPAAPGRGAERTIGRLLLPQLLQLVGRQAGELQAAAARRNSRLQRAQGVVRGATPPRQTICFRRPGACACVLPHADQGAVLHGDGCPRRTRQTRPGGLEYAQGGKAGADGLALARVMT